MDASSFVQAAQKEDGAILLFCGSEIRRRSQRTSSRGLDKTHVSRYRSLDAWVVAKAVDEQTSA